MRSQIRELATAVQGTASLLDGGEQLTPSEEAQLTRLTWMLAAKLHRWKQKAHSALECCHHALPKHTE
jgi:hypothetical protein